MLIHNPCLKVQILYLWLAFLPDTNDDREVMGLNEPQVWTLIGVFGTAMFGLVALVLTSIRGQFAGIHSEISSLRAGFSADLDGQIGSLRSEMIAGFAVVGSRIDSLGTRMDHLDRDVQLLMNREFGENRG